MPQTSYENPLGPLNPVSDSDATQLVSAETHAQLLAALMAELDQEAGGRGFMHGIPFRGVTHRRHRLVLAGSVVAAATAMVLGLPGLLAGGGSATEPAVAQAKLLAHISAALSRPETIVIEDERVHLIAGGYTQRNVTYSVETITETSRSGQQERTFVTGSYMRPGFQNVWTSNWEAVYDPADDTIYTGAENNGGPAFEPGDTSVFKQELDEHQYRLDGKATIDGRPALKLVPNQAGMSRYDETADLYPTVYVSPKTYHPMREVTPAPPGAKVRIAEVANWLSYKVLTGTAANRRLVSLSARHPHAHVVHSTAAMQRVYSREHTN